MTRNTAWRPCISAISSTSKASILVRNLIYLFYAWNLIVSGCWWHDSFSPSEIRQPVRIDNDFSAIHRQHTNSEYKVHPLIRALRCFELEPRKPICLVLADLGGRRSAMRA